MKYRPLHFLSVLCTLLYCFAYYLYLYSYDFYLVGTAPTPMYCHVNILVGFSRSIYRVVQPSTVRPIGPSFFSYRASRAHFIGLHWHSIPQYNVPCFSVPSKHTSLGRRFNLFTTIFLSLLSMLKFDSYNMKQFHVLNKHWYSGRMFLFSSI